MLACFLVNANVHTNPPMLVLFIYTGEVQCSVSVCDYLDSSLLWESIM